MPFYVKNGETFFLWGMTIYFTVCHERCLLGYRRKHTQTNITFRSIVYSHTSILRSFVQNNANVYKILYK